MITLLHVIECLEDFGGTPRKMLYLSRHADKRKYRLVFLTYQPSGLQKDFEAAGVEVVNISTLSPWKITRAIAATARQTNASAICTHFNRPLITGTLAGFLTRLPVIHHEHASPDLRRGMGARLVRLCYPWLDAVICNSAFTARRVLETYRISSRKVVYVHDPVEFRQPTETRQNNRDKLGIVDDAIVIGHVGGMIACRDQKTLLRTFGKLHDNEPKLRLVLIGDGPLRAELEALASSLNIKNSVIFTGYSDRIGDCLTAMDIYVNPTLIEGFGIAVVEAMQAGLPVVLADGGAHPELVEHGVEGFLYKAGNGDDLMDRLEFLIDHPEIRSEVGLKARESTDRFSGGRYADNYFEAIKNILLNAEPN